MRNDRPTRPSVPASPIYVERINRAIDHVLRHLDQPLPLATVARVACFSPFHFHRIFQLLTGESLSAFVKRVRLERAVALMSQHGWATRRRRSLTEIALACGFGSSTDFSRSFKRHFGAPPSRFDTAGFRARRRDAWQHEVADKATRHLLGGLPPGENPDHFAVSLRLLPPSCVAYLRVTNSYRAGAISAATGRMIAWAESHNLAHGQWLGYTWDDPEIVAPRHCRYDVGLEVPPHTPLPDGEICRIEFPGMQVAELALCGGIDLEMRALDWLYGTWLPATGWVPANHPCFEAWHGRPFTGGTETLNLTLRLSVERP